MIKTQSQIEHMTQLSRLWEEAVLEADSKSRRRSFPVGMSWSPKSNRGDGNDVTDLALGLWPPPESERIISPLVQANPGCPEPLDGAGDACYTRSRKAYLKSCFYT